MAKWQAPADAGPGVSIGGDFYPVVDGFVITPSDGDYFAALSPFGYVEVSDADPAPVAPVVEPAPAPAAPATEG